MHVERRVVRPAAAVSLSTASAFASTLAQPMARVPVQRVPAGPAASARVNVSVQENEARPRFSITDLVKPELSTGWSA